MFIYIYSTVDIYIYSVYIIKTRELGLLILHYEVRYLEISTIPAPNINTSFSIHT